MQFGLQYAFGPILDLKKIYIYVDRVKETVFTVQILSQGNYYSYKYPK